MTFQFIQSANEVAGAWLGEILGADVLNFSTRANLAFNSSVAHLEVTYASFVRPQLY